MARQNDDGTRSVELQIEVPGTPEEVWQAIATGAGISTWFTPSRVEEREGGEVHFDLAPGMESTGKVTRWAPFRKFAYEEANWNGEAPPLATVFLIEPIAGGKCVVRLVESLFTDSSEWDDQLDGMEKGWTAFLPILRALLTYFRGQPACPVRLVGASTTLSESETWAAIQSDLRLTDLTIGQSIDFEASDGRRLTGEVLGLGMPDSPHQLFIRTENPGPGLFYVGAHDIGPCVAVIATAICCGENANSAAADMRQRWQKWLDERFPEIATG